MSQRRVVGNGRRRQHGAVAVFAAVALIAILTSALLIIEIGRVYLAHRHLQTMASIAALDGARLVSGCGSAPSLQDLQTAVNQSLARNGDPAKLSTTNVEYGVVDTDPDSARRSLTPTALANAEAVRVTLTRPFPALLSSFLLPGGSVMTASATAQQAALGSLSIGSGLASVSNGILNALLSGLFGGNVSLTALDYNGLAGVNVSLSQLALALNVDVKDLSDPLALATQTPVLSDVLNGLANSLSGSVSASVSTLLRNLAAASSGNRNQIPLGDVLGAVDDGAAQVPFVNLLDLILALGEAANPAPGGGVQPVSLPIAIAIPGVASLSTFVGVLEPPQPSGLGRPGHTSASTAQIRLQLRLQVDALSNLSSVLTTLLLGTVQLTAQPINLGIDIDVAKASAFLDSLECPTRQDPSPVAELSARTSVTTVKLGTFSGDPATAPALSSGSAQLLGLTIKVLFGLGPTIVNNVFLANPVSVDIGSSTQSPLPQPVTQFTRVDDGNSSPYWTADRPVAANPQTVGSTQLIGGTLSGLFNSLNLSATDPNHPNASSTICVLLFVCIPSGTIVNATLASVKSTLGTVLTGTTLADSILDPLLKALGIQLGSATVTMEAATINQPHIVTQDRVITTP